MQHAEHNAINWFEIPVRNIDRAQKFYETLLAKPLRREAMGPQTLAVFDSSDAGVGGSLLAGEAVPAPSASGSLVYLNARPLLDCAGPR